MREVVARARALIALAVLVLLCGCSLSPSDVGGGPGKRLRDKLPLTWSADLSCPGCSAHWTTLTLFPDGSYRLRDRYAGQPAGSTGAADDEVFHDIGRWTLSLDDDLRLILQGASLTPRRFRLRDDGGLQWLDDQGREIRSIREYVLTPQHQVDPISGPMSLIGLYSRENVRMDEGKPSGDAPGSAVAWFSECRSGQRWRIKPSPQADEAARQYGELMAARQGASAPALLELKGRLDGAPDNGIAIERLTRLWPDARCRRDLLPPTQPLLETTWALLELHGETVPDSGIAQPAHLKFRQGGRLTGTTGCNRLQAAYLRDGARLSMPRPLITRMTCPQALQRQEQSLLAVLRATRAYRMVGNVLELRDGDTVLARLMVSEMP